jgi:endonuclease IV
MLGLHISKSNFKILQKNDKKTNDIVDTIIYYKQIFNFNSISLFVAGSRTNKIINAYKDEKNLKTIDELLKRYYISIHCNYNLINIFNETGKNKNAYVECYLKSIQIANSINADSYVLHIDSKHSREKIIEVTRQLVKYIEKSHIKLLLEPIAAKSNPYIEPENLNYIMENIQSENLGVCLDTTHLYLSGVDIAKEGEDFLKKFDRLSLIHLNGTSNELGSGKDKHEIVGLKKDKIFYGKTQQLINIMRFCEKNKIPMIMEINEKINEHEKYYLNKLCEVLI